LPLVDVVDQLAKTAALETDAASTALIILVDDKGFGPFALVIHRPR
jgi:hypothetical protein